MGAITRDQRRGMHTSFIEGREGAEDGEGGEMKKSPYFWWSSLNG